jgi:hypothetical protein
LVSPLSLTVEAIFMLTCTARPEAKPSFNRSLTMEEDQQAIRERAHQLWEAAGRPEGKEDHFWLEAERQLKEERIRHELKTPDTL